MSLPLLKGTIGEVLADRFVLRRQLGSGGFGTVFQAFDRRHECDVALKLLYQSDADALYRFKREFRSLAGMVHRNLVTLYELLSDGNQWFFTMELVEGLPLSEYLRNVPPTSRRRPSERDPSVRAREFVERICSSFLQLTQGIRALHQASILHRDLKPANVLVTEEGRVVLLDFGLVKELSPTWSSKGESSSDSLLGTPDYMAPEVFMGERVSEASDFYSVGVMLYEALWDKLPFEGNLYHVIAQKTRSEPRFPDAKGLGIPEDLVRLCRDLLRRDPRRRPSGEEIIKRLSQISSAESPASAREPEPRLFLGRERELATLMSSFQKTAAGETVLVRVHGKSGMGKTALCEKFLETLSRDRSTIVLRGRCHEREIVPYEAFDSLIDALSQYLSRLPTSAALDLIPCDFEDLVRLFPVLQRVAELLGPGETRGPLGFAAQEARVRAFQALKEMLTSIASRVNLVLFVDDLQWGDADSARLLGEILSPPNAPALLFLACHRGDDDPSGVFFNELNRILRETGAQISMLHIPVGPLAPDDAEHMAAARLGDTTATEERVKTIISEAEGNPFFIEELARAARMRTDVPTASEMALDRVILERVHLLSERDRRLLEIVAVAGRPLGQAIATRAAELGDAALQSTVTLCSEHLLKVEGTFERAQIESYHDRIREVVFAALPEEMRRAHHHRLAMALEAEGNADAEALAIHFKGACEPNKSRQYALLAAERASRALAFVRAAELYAFALESWDEQPPGEDAERTRIEIRRADALANAGRSRDAASLFLSCAERVSEVESLELRRRAAEQFLLGGYIEQGIDVLQPILVAMNIPYPKTTRLGGVEALLLGARLGLRGRAFEERPVESVPAEEIMRIDICRGAGNALANVDPQRALTFQLRALLLSLRAGEPGRIARSMAAVGSIVLHAGSVRSLKKGARLIEEAEFIAERLNDPALLGVIDLHAGFSCLVRGRWNEAVARINRGLERLKDNGIGVTWERDIGYCFCLVALDALGRFEEVVRRAAQWRTEAKEFGDLYGFITATLFWAMTSISSGDPGSARERASDVLAQWTRRGFHVQHLYALRIEAYADLYEGDPRAAYSRVSDAWRTIASSGFLGVQLSRFDMTFLRSRTEIALAEIEPSRREELLRSAEEGAYQIARELRSDAGATARLLLAGIAAVNDAPEAALAHLSTAEQGFGELDMSILAACARYQRGRILGGEEGASLLAEAETLMRNQAIASPAYWSRTLAPGFGVLKE